MLVQRRVVSTSIVVSVIGSGLEKFEKLQFWTRPGGLGREWLFGEKGIRQLLPFVRTLTWVVGQLHDPQQRQRRYE